MQKAKVTFKGQVTIPKEIRNALNIEEGESVVFAVEGDHAIMKPFIKEKGAVLFIKRYCDIHKKVGRI